MIRHLQTHRFAKARQQTFWWPFQDVLMSWRISATSGVGGPIVYRAMITLHNLTTLTVVRG